MKQTPASNKQSELRVYMAHVVALFRPGKTPRGFSTMPGNASKVGDLSNWDDDALSILIDEGRRKLDHQAARFDRLRQTAQVVLPIGVALMVVVGSELARIQAEAASCKRYVLYGGWGLAMTLVLVGTLGSASILVTRATFGTVLPTLLSQQDPGHLRGTLAETYADQVATGEDTLNTRLTLQWWSVFFLILGGIVFVALWGVRVV